MLAVAVLTLHWVWPEIQVLVWVALLSPLLAVAMLFVREGRKATTYVARHIMYGLPQMSGELLLFLAAGVLAAGISSAARGFEIGLLPDRFGATEASVVLAFMVMLAAVGIHPVIAISVLGGLLLPLAPDPNLVGMVFLMAWSLGVCVSPLSGMHLAMQGRFHLPATRFFRWNAPYVLVMWCVDSGLLHLYDHFMKSG
jgi:hypothetical protein